MNADLEHHLELRGEGEEGAQHGPHGHEHELKEQQAPQVVGAGHCVGLPRLQPEEPCGHKEQSDAELISGNLQSDTQMQHGVDTLLEFPQC